jgi:hypothetical protein
MDNGFNRYAAFRSAQVQECSLKGAAISFDRQLVDLWHNTARERARDPHFQEGLGTKQGSVVNLVFVVESRANVRRPENR